MHADEIPNELVDELRVGGSENASLDVLFATEDGNRDSISGAWRIKDIGLGWEPEVATVEAIKGFIHDEGDSSYPPSYSVSIERNVISWGASGDSWRVVLWLAEMAAAAAAQYTFSSLASKLRGSANVSQVNPMHLNDEELNDAMMEAAWFVEETLEDKVYRWMPDSSPLDHMAHVGTEVTSESAVFRFRRGDRLAEVEMFDVSRWATVIRWAWVKD